MEEKNRQEWVSVHKHLDEMFQERWKGHDTYHVATEDAHRREHRMLDENLRKALDVLDERFAAHNEWRRQLTEERADLVTRKELESLASMASGRLNRVETELANLQGRMTTGAAALAIGLVILQIFLKFVVGP